MEATKTYEINGSGPPDDPNTLLTAKEAAAYLRVGYSTLARFRMSGEGPAYGRVGGTVVYRKQDLDTYVAKTLRYSTVSRKHPVTGELPPTEV